MIDLNVIGIEHPHEPFGSTRTLKRENKTGNTKLLSKKIFINQVPVIVTSLNQGSRINIRCCPLKVLQGHNVFGTNNPVRMWVQIIIETLNELGVEYSEQQLHEWKRGEFDIEEIHITHRFPVAQYSMVRQLISHLRRYSSEILLPTPLRKGVGVSLRAPHGQAEMLIYDKYQEFCDKRTKEQKYLQAVIGEDAEFVAIKLMATASKSARAELKLTKQYLNDAGKTRASTWSSSTAIEVFNHEFELLRIGQQIPTMPQLPELYAGINNLKLRTVVIMWANGEDITSHYGSSTVRKYRKAVMDELGIDILKDRPVLETASLKLADVFDTDRMLTGFPKWTRDYPAIAFR